MSTAICAGSITAHTGQLWCKYMHLFSLCFYVFILLVRAAAFQSASLLDPISVLTKGADTGRLNRPGFNLSRQGFSCLPVEFLLWLTIHYFPGDPKVYSLAATCQDMRVLVCLLVSRMSLEQTLAMQTAEGKVQEKLCKSSVLLAIKYNGNLGFFCGLGFINVFFLSLIKSSKPWTNQGGGGWNGGWNPLHFKLLWNRINKLK